MTLNLTRLVPELRCVGVYLSRTRREVFLPFTYANYAALVEAASIPTYILKKIESLALPRKSKDQTLPIGSRESFTWIILKTILCLVLDLQGLQFCKKVALFAIQPAIGLKNAQLPGFIVSLFLGSMFISFYAKPHPGSQSQIGELWY